MTALRAVLALIPLFSVLAAVAAEDRFTFPNADLVLQPEAGLIWMRCSYGQRMTDGRCAGDAERLTWTEVRARVDTLAAPDCPWRVPEFHELRGLIEPDGEPVLDPRAFPDTPDGWFWSNARAGGHSQHDCFVDFAGRGRTRCNMGGRFHLRAVMTGDAARTAACTPGSDARGCRSGSTGSACAGDRHPLVDEALAAVGVAVAGVGVAADRLTADAFFTPGCRISRSPDD